MCIGNLILVVNSVTVSYLICYNSLLQNVTTFLQNATFITNCDSRFHGRIKNNKINRLHERCMHLRYGDKTSSFEELLEQDKFVSIHTRTQQMFAQGRYIRRTDFS